MLPCGERAPLPGKGGLLYISVLFISLCSKNSAVKTQIPFRKTHPLLTVCHTYFLRVCVCVCVFYSLTM